MPTFEADDTTVAEILDGVESRGEVKLTEVEALGVAEAYGINVVPWSFVDAGDGSDLPERVADAAVELGLPVALKVVSPQIIHKTDLGGVALDLGTREEVEDTTRRLRNEVPVAAAAAGSAGVEISGILVQQMAESGRETIVGLTRMPSVGPMVMFGLGGVYVEVMRDVVLRLCPIHDSDAEEMIREVRMFKLLEGVRGEAPRDLGALAEAILRISQLAARHTRICEMDINPLLSLAEGAVAVDVRVQLGG